MKKTMDRKELESLLGRTLDFYPEDQFDRLAATLFNAIEAIYDARGLCLGVNHLKGCEVTFGEPEEKCDCGYKFLHEFEGE